MWKAIHIALIFPIFVLGGKFVNLMHRFICFHIGMEFNYWDLLCFFAFFFSLGHLDFWDFDFADIWKERIAQHIFPLSPLPSFLSPKWPEKLQRRLETSFTIFLCGHLRKQTCMTQSKKIAKTEIRDKR